MTYILSLLIQVDNISLNHDLYNSKRADDRGHFQTILIFLRKSSEYKDIGTFSNIKDRKNGIVLYKITVGAYMVLKS